MRDNLKILILIGVVGFAITLAAIFVVNRRVPVVKEQTVAEATTVSSVEDITGEKTETAEVSSVLAVSETPEADQNSDAAVPTARAGLESTNPEEVKLASGDLQLIELFAFW